MTKKKWFKPICIIVGIVLALALGVIIAGRIFLYNGYGIMVGRLLILNNSYMLIEENTSTIISNQSGNKDLFDGLSIGDKLLVVHDGVETSLPSRTGAYHIFRLEKGDEGDIPEDALITITEVDEAYNIDENTSTKAWCSNGDASMSLLIPEGWSYEVQKNSETNSDEFGIQFWPKGQTEGKISLMYYTVWGVCGTGLEEIKIMLGEYNAYQGTYDNKDVWDYICLADTQGKYVALNQGADVWWDEYGTEAMSILSTLQISKDIITKCPTE